MAHPSLNVMIVMVYYYILLPKSGGPGSFTALVSDVLPTRHGTVAAAILAAGEVDGRERKAPARIMPGRIGGTGSCKQFGV